MENIINYTRWEDDEFVITVNGGVCGGTLHEREAKIIADWLKTAVPEIRKYLLPSNL